MRTSISESFRDGTILITGSTGFLGKLLTEKLLRSSCVKKIALLVRHKRELDVHQRVAKIFKQPVFDQLRKEKPDFMDSIRIAEGNLEEKSLGLSTSDRDWLIENVNFVFHCAATIKFNEPLEVAAKTNIQGTKNVLALATEMKNLKGMVHVSTAYSHCPENEILEKFYPVPVRAEDLTNQIDFDESIHDVLKKWPNTYTFTKAITENLILANENHLPISIFRPSIIGCTKSEPDSGWLENVNGPSGIITGIIVGFSRIMPLSADKITDIVPVDYTVNALISVMWDTVNRFQDSNEENKKPKIFNYVSSVESPLIWKVFIQELKKMYQAAPPMRSMWYIFCIYSPNFWIVNTLRLMLHRIPSAMIDFSLYISGKKPKMMKLYKKAEYMTDMLHEFTTKEWKFDNSNTRELWSSLNEEDRNTFWFNLENFDWEPYLQNYCYGIRRHVLHEDIDNKEKALEKHRKLYWLHQLLIVLIICLVFQILCCIFV